MEIGSSTWNLKSKTSWFVVLMFVLGCKDQKRQRVPENETRNGKLEDGVIVCRLGNGFFSNYFREYASYEKEYSHLGIISNENDALYVYHCEASELTGIGFVKKEPLDSFLKGIRVFDFFEFNYPDSEKKRIMKEVEKYYRNRTPFDLEFDSFNDDRLYCTELIATSINKALDTIMISPSLVLNGIKLYSLDDIYQNKDVKKITFANDSYGGQDR